MKKLKRKVKKVKHKPVKQHENYKIEGGKVKRLRKVCDRCGDGTFMAGHKDRWYCGKCGMTIWKKKEETVKEGPTKEAKKETKKGPKEQSAKQSVNSSK